MSISQTIKKEVTVEVEAEITTNDIFNWIVACNDTKTLRYLAKAANNRASAIENPDYDDFHSL